MDLIKVDETTSGLKTVRVAIKDGDCETFLGRNAVTEITDPKVSRKQASVKYDCPKNQWLLNTLASRHCRYKPLSGDWTHLAEDVTVPLFNGDQFSLLDDLYIYSVALQGNIDEDDSIGFVTTRTLPLWMQLNSAEKSEAPSSQPKPDKLQEVSKEVSQEKESKNEGSGLVLIKNSTPNKKVQPTTSDKSNLSPAKSSFKVVHDLSNSGDEALESLDCNISPRKELTDNNSHIVSESEDEEVLLPGTSQSSATNTQDTIQALETSLPRRTCPYGSNCYRKNPQHRKEMAHPGDLDYKEDDPDVRSPNGDDRPECEYGTNCYRKNPQHRLDFKHSTRPKRAAAAANNIPDKRVPKKKKQSDQGDSGDEYDSSFIDDDSEKDLTPDEDEEEEWLPSEPVSD